MGIDPEYNFVDSLETEFEYVLDYSPLDVAMVNFENVVEDILEKWNEKTGIYHLIRQTHFPVFDLQVDIYHLMLDYSENMGVIDVDCQYVGLENFHIFLN